MDLKEIEWNSVECIHLADDRDKRRAFGNKVKNPWVRNSWTDERLLASQDGLNSLHSIINYGL